MKLEQALDLLRNGKKIRHPSFEKDEYLMACYVGLIFDDTIPKILSITKMKGEYIHPDMKPDNRFICQDLCGKKYLHLFPQLNLLTLLDDTWEIIE